MQWLALEHPATVKAIQYFVRSIVSDYRKPLPAVALSLELSPELQYRTVKIYDIAALVPTAAENRIGRLMQDIMPADLVEMVARAVHQSRRTRRPTSYIYDRGPGGKWKGTINTPNHDSVILDVTRAK